MNPWLRKLRDLFIRRPITVWYAPRYRLPVASLEATTGMATRRADFVAWYLFDRRLAPESAFRSPTPVAYADIGRVHSEEYLESLTHAETLARIFACAPEEVPVDSVMQTVRLACGGTLAAARESLKTRAPAMNLLGGFHHAGRNHGAGFCALNDLAIAVAALRAEGFAGRVCIVDLDAHQPDGTASCLRDDANCWIGSISGASWGDLPGVDEVILSPGTGDDVYMRTLEKLLSRMPRPDLAFVLAGGDVLQGDRLGMLGLTLDGTRRRDIAVANALAGVPSVWLPAGGYQELAWRVFAGVAIALTLRSRRAIREGYDPLQARFRFISRHLEESDLTDSAGEDRDIAAVLGLRRSGPPRLLGYYTAEGIEQVFFRYGLLDQLEGLGYSHLRFLIDETGQGDRLRVFGSAAGTEYMLIENVLEKKRFDEGDFLYVHWLTLRHPLARADGKRPLLPGQDYPGLGIARECGELFVRIATRLGLDGVAFRPAGFHTAYSARYRMKFIDAARQARFEAMIRDFSSVPLFEATTAVAEGQARLNGQPYAWEPDLMVAWLDERAHKQREVAAVPEYHFTLEPPRGPVLEPVQV